MARRSILPGVPQAVLTCEARRRFSKRRVVSSAGATSREPKPGIALRYRPACTSAGAIRNDEVVGSRYNSNCERDYTEIPEPQRLGLGRPIPIHVLVRDKKTGAVTMDRVFNTLCKTSAAASGLEKTRTVGRFHIPAGEYIAEIRNMASQAGLDEVTTTVSLVSGDRK
jgi:hypothetical protein